MGDNYFDHIAKELLKQQHLMEKLARENQELHRELAQLRAGKGIALEIGGQRIALMGDALQAKSTSEPQEVPFAIAEAPTAMMEASPVRDMTANISSQSKEKSKREIPSFLEEIMLDEFASAMTNPLAAITPKQAERNTAEQRAVLRRELMGSYLLE